MSLKVDLSGTRSLIHQIKEIEKMFPEEVNAVVLEVALVDVETYAKREVDIPVDSGRLRASIHTKFGKKPEPEVSKSKQRMQQKAARSENGMPQSQLNYSYYVPTQTDENGNVTSEGGTFDGTLKTPIGLDYVIVGTNVEYAQKINRVGGGGENSRSQLPKGTGQGFFDKAVKNGEIQLRKQMSNLVSRMDRMAKRAAEKAKRGGDA